MPTLNPTLAYLQPPERKAVVADNVALPEDWLTQMIQVTLEHLESVPSFDFSAHINAHVGSESTYIMKEQIIEGLQTIYLFMVDAQTNTDNKYSMALKLVERAENCTAGFHDGVNSIIEVLERPESIDALLHRIRHAIVSKTANQTTDEVHSNNRFFTVAQIAGYGVLALNPNDVYTGSISDEVIRQKLAAAFARDYQWYSLLIGIEDQIRSELLTLEYTGSREEGYDADIMDKFLAFLTALFNDAPAVIKQREAIELQQAYEQRTRDVVISRRDAVRELIPSLTNENLVDSLIRNTFPASLKPKYLTSLTAEAKGRLADIQEHYTQFLKSEEMTSLAARMVATSSDRASPFQLIEEGHLNLNWNQIRQTIWEEIHNKQYVVLTAQERVALDGLLDRQQPFNLDYCNDLLLNGVDVAELLTLMQTLDDKRQTLLRWYISAANETPDAKMTTVSAIRAKFKHDAAISAVLEEFKSEIDELIQALRQAWMDKLSRLLELPWLSFHLPQYLSEDKVFMMKAVVKYGVVLKHACAELKADRELVLAAVRQNGMALQYAFLELQSDREVVLAAVRKNGESLEYASRELRSDLEVVLAAVRQYGAALQYASRELQSDREVVLAAVRKNGGALQYASRELRSDLEVVLAAVRQYGAAFQYASRELRADRAVVLAAVRQYGAAFQYASRELRADRAVVLAAIGQDARAIELAAPPPTFLRSATQRFFNVFGRVDSPPTLQADRAFMLDAVAQNGLVLQYASETLQNDRSLVLAAVTQNGLALQYVCDALREDREIILAAVNQNDEALQYARLPFNVMRP